MIVSTLQKNPFHILYSIIKIYLQQLPANHKKKLYQTISYINCKHSLTSILQLFCYIVLMKYYMISIEFFLICQIPINSKAKLATILFQKSFWEMFRGYFAILAVILIVTVQTNMIDDSLASLIGKKKSGEALSSNDYKNFEFINVHQIEGNTLYVFITFDEEASIKNQKVLLYKYDEKVTLIDSCIGDKNIFTCSISAQQGLKENITLMIGLSCTEQCKYHLVALWNKLEEIEPNFSTPFYFGKEGKQQVFHMNLQNQTFKELRLTLEPKTKQQPTDRVAIYGKYGWNVLPSEKNYDFKSITIWNQSQGVFLDDVMMESKKISFLIVGETDTVYQFRSQLIKTIHHDLQLNETINQYLMPKSVRLYHVSFPKKNNIDHIISFSSMIGEIQVSYFKDKQLTIKFQQQPFTYHRDSKLVITQQQQQYVSELYIRVQSKLKDSVYVLYYQQKEQYLALQLAENVDQYLVIPQEELVYFQFSQFKNQSDKTIDEKSSEITVNIINVYGDLEQQFRVCKGLLSNCINKKTYMQNSQKINHYDSSLIGLHKVFKLKIDDTYKNFINQVEKVGYIIIVFKIPKQKSTEQKSNPSQVIVQYMHNSEMQVLRDVKPLEDIIEFKQKKYYKFQYSDLNVTAIKIRLNVISGNAVMKSYREDPRYLKSITNSDSQINLANQNPITITTKTNQPIFIEVTGLAQTTFGLIPQVFHKADGMMSTIGLNEQVEFTLKIKPRQFEIFILHPLYNSLTFKYKSTGTVFACFLNKEGQCQNELPEINSQGELQLDNVSKPEYLVRLANPSTDRSVAVKVVYHSLNFNHCQLKNMGKFEHTTIKNNGCIGFNIDANPLDIEIYATRIDLGQLRTKIYICQQYVQLPESSARFLIKKNIINQYCNNRTATDKTLGFMFQGSNNQSNIKIEYLVQYANNSIILPDGLAYRMQTTSIQKVIKYFYYELLNKIDTKIELKDYAGKCTFFTKVFPIKQKYTTMISRQDYQDKPKSFFSNIHDLLINAADIQKYCPDTECALHIAVYSQSDIGETIDFSIQVTQNQVVLKDFIPYQAHLAKDSMAYYSYYLSEFNSSMLIETSDNNQNCVQMYLSRNNFPSQLSYIRKQTGSKMVHQGGKGKFYIGVKAIQNCIYSITASSSPYHLVKLERGKPVNLNMQKGQLYYFIFRHISDLDFKIVTLHEYGRVKLYLNQSQNEHILGLKANETIQYKSFMVEGEDNLALGPKNQGFCSNCFYTLVVQALQKTISSISQIDSNTPIDIIKNKIFNDRIINKNEKTMIKFNGVPDGELECVVIKGKIQVTVKTENSSYAKKALNMKKETQNVQFLIGHQMENFWTPIFADVQCLVEPCVYTLSLKQKLNNGSKSLPYGFIRSKLLPGNPSYFFMGPGVEHCFDGYFQSKNEQIVFSSNDRSKNKILRELNITAKIGQKNITQIHKTFAQNVLQITFNPTIITPQKHQSFQICFKNDGNLSLSGMAEQVGAINLLPQDTQVVVNYEDTFMLYPGGNYLLDVFECSGQAAISRGQNEKDLLNKQKFNQTFSLVSNGMPGQSHAVKLQAYTSEMIKVKSSLSLVRWFPYDEKANLGLGYMKYQVGAVEYSLQDQGIKIQWKTLSVNKTLVDKNYQVVYKIYLSHNQEFLKSASQCERFLEGDVIMYQPKVEQPQVLNSNASFILNKEQILSQFPNVTKVFVTIVADLHIIKEIEGQKKFEDYRFLYSDQQIPNQVLSQDTSHRKTILLIVFIAAAVIGVIALACMTWILTKKLIPMISRIRTRNLVEDQPQNRQGDEIVPPSSDRQRIIQKKVIET